MTTLTPPVRPDDAGMPEPTGGGNGRAISVVITVIGSVLLVGMLVIGILGGIRALSAGSTDREKYRVEATGATSLSMDVSSADVEVRFTDVSEARLDVDRRGSTEAGSWSLTREGDVLRVAQDDFMSWSFGWDFGTEQVVLQLPRGLEQKLDADIDVSAGKVTLAGDYRDVKLRLNAGNVVYDGAAEAMRVNVSAGGAAISASDVKTVDLGVSAGTIDADFAGRQPDLTKVEASAGDIRVTLPHGTYSVQQNETAGDLSVNVPTDPSASSRIDARVTAGDVRIDSAD